MPTSPRLPYLGFGIGLRTDHYQTVLEQKPAIDWFEVMTEDYLVAGGRPLYYLHQTREHYPIAMHGVSLSIGSVDPLNYDYLQKVKTLAADVQPAWISDHLCWTGVNGLNTHDLLPLPYTEEALKHIVSRVQAVQDFLGRQLVLENVSSYITYQHSHMQEWEFLTAVAQEADALILLDINNIYVSAFNHGFNPHDYLQAIPVHRVQQYHLAGHKNLGDHIIDTHDAPIIDPVWDLYAEAVRRFGKISVLIERDDHIPPLADLQTELEQARRIAETVWAE